MSVTHVTCVGNLLMNLEPRPQLQVKPRESLTLPEPNSSHIGRCEFLEYAENALSDSTVVLSM